MDQCLVKLLSHALNQNRYETDKRLWLFVTKAMRSLNWKTAYSTCTKYACQQHLFRVIHRRYKIWYALHIYQPHPSSGLSYRWNSDCGKMEIFNNASNTEVEDEGVIKDYLLRRFLPHPDLSRYNKVMLTVNELFLTENLDYLSIYHDVVLPYLVSIDSRYADVGIPQFSGSITKIYKGVPKLDIDVSTSEAYNPQMDEKPIIIDINSASGQMLANAAIAATESPPVVSKSGTVPIYMKDREWFRKLMSLHEKEYITCDEVLGISSGVRDGKIPLFMLNILDASYGDSEPRVSEPRVSEPDDTIAKRVRNYLLPMAYR